MNSWINDFFHSCDHIYPHKWDVCFLVLGGGGCSEEEEGEEDENDKEKGGEDREL